MQCASSIATRQGSAAAGLYVEDLGSLNGTKVNGRRVKDRAELKEGDLITVGSMRFRVTLELKVEADESVARGSVRKPLKIPLTREVALKKDEDETGFSRSRHTFRYAAVYRLFEKTQTHAGSGPGQPGGRDEGSYRQVC